MDAERRERDGQWAAATVRSAVAGLGRFARLPSSGRRAGVDEVAALGAAGWRRRAAARRPAGTGQERWRRAEAEGGRGGPGWEPRGVREAGRRETSGGGVRAGGRPRRGPARVQSRRHPRGGSGLVRTRPSGAAPPGPGVQGGSGGQRSGRGGGGIPPQGRCSGGVSAGRAGPVGSAGLPKRGCGRVGWNHGFAWTRARTCRPRPPAARYRLVAGQQLKTTLKLVAQVALPRTRPVFLFHRVLFT